MDGSRLGEPRCRAKDPREHEIAAIEFPQDPDDPHINDDVQFGVTKVLMGDYIRHDEPHASGSTSSVPWYSLDHTYVMEPGEAVLPKPPIK
jgi:hypothetical protein